MFAFDPAYQTLIIMGCRLAVDGLGPVFELCSTETLVSCAQTCKALRAGVASEFRVRFATILSPFFGDRVPLFKCLLTLHGAVVSGSAALAFFAWPAPWSPSDLDVYVGDTLYNAFVLDLEHRFPVTLDADMFYQRPGRYTGIKGVRRYITSSGRRIDVIRSVSPSAVSPLLYFWSSVVVNFITPHGAVCGYPNLTLSNEGIMDGVTPTAKVISARTKYEGRGFSFTGVDAWRPWEYTLQDGCRVFKEGALLTLDFRTVWTFGRQVLPITRTPRHWVLRPLPLRDVSGKIYNLNCIQIARCLKRIPRSAPTSDRSRATSIDSASVDRSQSTVVRTATLADVERDVRLVVDDSASSMGL